MTFDECFVRFHRLVATIGLRMLGHRDEIEDFVQDVFLEVHKSYGSLQDPKALKGWIRSIAVRVAIRRLRRRKVRSFLGFDVLQEEPLVDGQQEQAAFIGQVYRALDGVPPKARVCWVLRHIEGEKLTDIATLTNMGLSSVKRHLATATAQLQEVFDDA